MKSKTTVALSTAVGPIVESQQALAYSHGASRDVMYLTREEAINLR